MLSNYEQKERKSRIAAIAGTILFHALILVSLILLALHTPDIPKDDGNVEISYNYIFDSLGDIQAETPSPVPDSKTQISEVVEEQTISVKEKEIAVIDNKKKDKSNNVTIAKPKAIVETPDERTIIHKTPDAVKNTRTSTAVNQATAAKPGEKVKSGEPPASAQYDDKAGNGIGVWYELAGRGYISLPKPAFDKPVQGKIVVTIIVSREGKVIYAGTGTKGTTIQDIQLRQRAENTARKTIFTPVKEASEEQKGTITYVFEKQK